MKKAIILALFATLFISALLAAQALPAFTSDFLPKKTMFGKEIGVTYTSIIKYFGYIKPGMAPDEVKNGKKMFYIYVWIPAIAPEIGVRMVSPIASIKPEPKPGAKDFQSASYKEGAADKTNFFDTWVSFERADGIVEPGDIESKSKKIKWISYGSNDDSSELMAQPSGSNYNSVLRVLSETSNPMKALIRGLYRVGFTTYKTGEVQGTFYAEIGAPLKLPGVIVNTDLTEIAKAAK